MQSLDDFDVFIAVVESVSISSDARILEIPRATLSRRLSQLEEPLGVRLLNKTARTLALAQARKTLYPRAKKLQNDAAEIIQLV